LNRNLETTLNDIANSVVAYILSGTVDWSVNARETDVGRVHVTSVDSTVVVVVTEVRGQVNVLASNGGVASIYGARVVIITHGIGDGRVSALGGLVLGVVRPVASINGTSVVIVTVRVNHASRRRAEQVGVDDVSSRVIASVQAAFVAGRDSLIDSNTSRSRYARPKNASVSLSSGTVVSGLRSVQTGVLVGVTIGAYYARIVGTSVIIITGRVISSSAKDTGFQEGSLDNSSAASEGGTICVGRYRLSCVHTSSRGGRIAGIRVTKVTQLASGRGIDNLAVVVARVGRVYRAGNRVARISVRGTVAIAVASNLARAQVGVDLSSSRGIAGVTSTSSVRLDRVGGSGTRTSASRITSIGEALVSSNTLGRRMDEVDSGAASSVNGGGAAQVGVITTIRGNTRSSTSTQTTASSAGLGGGRGITSNGDQISNKTLKFSPVRGGQYLRSLTLGDKS